MEAESTICAIATAQGGALGIIRVSGIDAINITDKIFAPKDNIPLKNRNPYTLAYGKIYDKTEVIDEVLVSIFHAPHSYTGENSTEISFHNSTYIANRILNLLIESGCRQATPGEYTLRAFMNGKMDLSQAEAVADLIASTNKATHKMAINQLRGKFSVELQSLRQQLIHITSLIELGLDFSDHEELEFANYDELLSLAEKIEERISYLLKSFKTGQAIKRGIPVAIIGKTNVGKSTLLNQLLEDDKAIVSNIHGTTRDVIEDTMDINGVTFRFIDTAGIRKTTDEIESLGIERTFKKIEEASIIIWVTDNTPSDNDIIDIKPKMEGKRTIIALNKTDTIKDVEQQIATLKEKTELFSINNSSIIDISAKQGTNISELKSIIYDAANIPEIKENDVIVTSIRHYNALFSAHQNMTNLINGIKQNISSDLLSEDLRQCIHCLNEIIGDAIRTEDTLESIFSNFCIGK